MNRFELRNEPLKKEMLGHIKQYRSSGLSQTKYCRKFNLSYARLFYWLKKDQEITAMQSSQCELLAY